MIPKTIHYCWFGNKPKDAVTNQCIETWRRKLPDYEIKEWNESNFSIHSSRYVEKMYELKKWAFVSDYVRLEVLEKFGGIYLDTDMFILQPFDQLLKYKLFIGKEDEKFVSAGIIGCIAHHPFILKTKNIYDNNQQNNRTIPAILTDIYNSQEWPDIKMFNPEIFYPFTALTIKNFDGCNAPTSSISVHMWNYSWGSPISRKLHRQPFYRILVKILSFLRIKDIIKRIIRKS
jgi:mannosyltransferase OCH1-like enzyme